MNKLEDVDIGALRDALADASSVKAAKRLISRSHTRMVSASKRLASGTISRVRPCTRGSTDSNTSRLATQSKTNLGQDAHRNLTLPSASSYPTI
jgi:hypothetical protein